MRGVARRLGQRISLWTLAGGVSAVLLAAQPPQPKTIAASVTVTTSDSRRNVAVISRGTGGAPAFLFCIDLKAPLPQKIDFTGQARVIYRPLPLGDLPAGVKVSGPENVSSALAVLPTGAKGWLFLAKNEKTVLPAGDRAAAGATVVPARIVRRLDWVGDDGVRRAMDVEPCFVAGG
jgi:hypothetical protein